MMYHTPTHTRYFIAYDKTKAADRLTIFDMIARLTHVSDGHPVPPPDHLTALGRAALLVYVCQTDALWDGPVEAVDEAVRHRKERRGSRSSAEHGIVWFILSHVSNDDPATH